MKLLLVLFLSMSISCAQDVPAPQDPQNPDVGQGQGQGQGQQEPQIKDMNVPATEIAPSAVPTLYDDGDLDFMLIALDRQLQAFKRMPLKGNLNISGKTYPMTVLQESVELFKTQVLDLKSCLSSNDPLLCRQQFDQNLKQTFRWYRPVVANNSKAHFTGYYSPTFHGTKERTATHKYGVYAKPSDETLRLMTRNQILFDEKLEGHNLELFYLDDPFELYLLHIEGGGVVDYYENGVKKQAYLSYDGTNSQSFRFIGPYMKSKGYIKDLSIASQRKFMQNNPSKWQEIYDQCPNFIYFKITKSEPLGMENIPLTPGRSKAQDRSIFWRKGMLGFVVAKKPVMPLTDKKVEDKSIPKVPLTRFFVDQDTGGAIRGEARADLYWGYGDEAQFLAENLNEQGDLYFMIKK